MEIYGVIYKIENLVNGKVYIGQTTKGFDKRYRGHSIEGVYKYHKSKFESNDNYNKHLYNAIEKYGFENFKVYEQFDIAFSKIELDIKEKVYITLYNSTNKEYGYNNKEGGANGKHTEETKRKISLMQMGENNYWYGTHGPMYGKTTWNKGIKTGQIPWNKGKHISEETKKHLSEINKGKFLGENHPMYGKHHTEEAKNKISQSLKGNTNMLGKHHSEETREKLRQINKGKFVGEKSPRYGKTCEQNGNSKPCRCIETGIVYPCAAEATRQTGITHITDVCLGKRKRAGGYTWEYINKD